MPRLDSALIVLILALIAVFGILPGMSAGLAVCEYAPASRDL